MAVSAFIVFVLNIPFWSRLHAAVEPQKFSEWLFFGAAAAALLLLTNLLLLLIARRYLFRVVLAVVLPRIRSGRRISCTNTASSSTKI